MNGDLFFLDQQQALKQAQRQIPIEDQGTRRLQYCYYDGTLTDQTLANFIHVRLDDFVDFFANNRLPIPQTLIDQQGNLIDIRQQMPDVIEEIEQFRAGLKIKDYIHQDTDFFNALEALNTAKQSNPVCCGPSMAGLQICYHHDPALNANLQNLVYVDIDNLLPFFVQSRLRIPKQLNADPALSEDYRQVVQSAMQVRSQLNQELVQSLSTQRIDYTDTPLRIMVLAGRFAYRAEDDLAENISGQLINELEKQSLEVFYYRENSAMECLNELDFLLQYQAFRPHILIQFNRLCNHFLHPDTINLVYWTGLTRQLGQSAGFPFRKNDFNITASESVKKHLKRCGARHILSSLPDGLSGLHCPVMVREDGFSLQLNDNVTLKAPDPKGYQQLFQQNMQQLEKHRPGLFRWLSDWMEHHQITIQLGDEIDDVVYDCRVWVNQQLKYQLNIEQLELNRKRIEECSADAAWLLTNAGSGHELHWLWDKTHQPFKDCLDMEVPVYLLASDAGQLLLSCLLHDYGKLWQSSRARVFFGGQVLAALQTELADLYMPLPTQLVPVAGSSRTDYETVIEHVQQTVQARQQQFQQDLSEIQSYYNSVSIQQWTAKFQPENVTELKVLGITSRFTSFLQYCMRDWLNGFSQLGAQTDCYIESENHQRGCMQQLVAQINRFKPDLIVNIDHFRHELSGIPENIPYVNWIQDRLPNIMENKQVMDFFDYTYVYAKDWLTMNDYPEYHQYPVEFLPVGVNETLYRPLPDQNKVCDLLFVTHLVDPELTLEPIRTPDRFTIRWSQKELAVLNKGLIGKEELLNIYQWLEQYSRDMDMQEYNKFCFADPTQTLQLILSECKLPLDCYDEEVHDLLPAIVDNRLHYEALTRMKQWPVQMLLDELPGLNIHLYGKNWSQYPRFKPLWQGIAENGETLNLLMNQAKICLNASPGSTMHMRAMETIASGAFMLTRKIVADSSSIWEFFSSDEIIGCSDSDELVGQVKYYLANPAKRQQVAQKARARLLSAYSYSGIARRIITDVEERLQQHGQ